MTKNVHMQRSSWVLACEPELAFHLFGNRFSRLKGQPDWHKLSNNCGTYYDTNFAEIEHSNCPKPAAWLGTEIGLIFFDVDSKPARFVSYVYNCFAM